jgi:hypothetical protein
VKASAAPAPFAPILATWQAGREEREPLGLISRPDFAYAGVTNRLRDD